MLESAKNFGLMVLTIAAGIVIGGIATKMIDKRLNKSATQDMLDTLAELDASYDEDEEPGFDDEPMGALDQL